MLNKYIKEKYDADKTILECNKCGHQEIEWYNDQPADPCPEVDCIGKMVRVFKSEKSQNIEVPANGS